jgi:hypothetical protein
MARHVEPLYGGVWTKPDPSLLEPGQLSAGRNFVYLPGSPAIYRAAGRNVFGAASGAASNVAGLRDAQFDEGPHVLAAVVGSALVTALATGVSGNFVVLSANLGGVPSQLEAVQYRNRFYLLNGIKTSEGSEIGTNKCLYVSATGSAARPSLRQAGMVPVRYAPTVTATAGTFSLTVTGNYDYWTTEVANIKTDGGTLTLESAFEPPVTTVSVGSTAVVPIIHMPPIKNPNLTTHWRIYRSPVKTLVSDPGFPTGYLISELAATGVSAMLSAWDSGSTSAGSSFYPSASNSGTNGYADWASASSAYTDNGAFASAIAQTDKYVGQGFYGFAFSGINGNINGLEVTFQAYVSNGSGPIPMSVYIAPNRTLTGYPEKRSINAGSEYRWAYKYSNLVSATTSANAQTITVGSSADTWFGDSSPWPLTPSDFNGNFMVILTMQSNLVGQNVGVDYVSVKPYYQKTMDSTVPFETVVYTYGEEAVQTGRNGPPPSSSTGDVFQDSLVVNDLSDPSLIRYSYSGKPESFPATYFLNFESRENDAVSLIKVVNNRLIVALSGSLWRVNYLPTDNDASFDRGKALEAVSRSYGVVNPMCACVFSPGGDSELLAFVSNQGVHCTDGYSLTTLTDGLDWRGGIMPTGATAIALVNDKENCILKFYFRNPALTPETDMCLPLCYGGGHWVSGRAKVGGLIHVRNVSGANTAELKSVCQFDHSGTSRIAMGYGGNNAAAGAGSVFLELGTTIPAADSTVKFSTRRMYLAGMTNEFALNEVYGYSGSYDGSPVVSYTAKNVKTNATAETTSSAKSLTLAGQSLHKVVFRQMCEGLTLNATITASAYRQESLILDGENWGLEDSGR